MFELVPVLLFFIAYAVRFFLNYQQNASIYIENTKLFKTSKSSTNSKEKLEYDLDARDLSTFYYNLMFRNASYEFSNNLPEYSLEQPPKFNIIIRFVKSDDGIMYCNKQTFYIAFQKLEINCLLRTS